MLKTLPISPNPNFELYESKCAEIHYKDTDFSIHCVFCRTIALDYQQFLEHFERYHIEAPHDSTSHSIKSMAREIDEKFEVLSQPENDPLSTAEIEINENTIKADDKVEIMDLIRDNKNNNVTKVLEIATTNEISRPLHYEEPEGFDSNGLPRDIKTENLILEKRDDNDSDDGSSCSSPVEDDQDWTKEIKYEKRRYKPHYVPNECSYCKRTFRRRYQLETHLNIHTGEKPHQCEICGRQFRAVTTLSRHLNTHERREAYNCKYCEKIFTHRAALVSHELRHTQERNHPCDDCGKLFYTTNQMDTHKRRVHHKSDGGMLPFACDFCSKRYRSASMLSTHKFKKHYKTAKYTCEICEKKFIDERQLKGHKRIHVHTNL